MMMSLIILFNICVYGFGLVLCYYKGLRENLIFSFSWLMFSIYYFLTPWYFYSIGRRTIWGDDAGYQGVGEDIYDYYDEGLLYYGIANLLFLIGFYFISRYKPNFKIKEFIDNKSLIVVIYFICLGLVLINFSLTGFSIIDIIRGNSDETLFGATGASNYLKNFADSMITCLILCYVIKVDKRILVGIYLISFVLFALMGFRYRMIMTIFGVLLIVLFNYELKIKNIIKPFIVAMGILYLILFITVNRYPLIVGHFNEFVYNPIEFNAGNLLAEQTRGALDDINIIKYYETNDHPEYDYGVTFTYFIVRAIPRFILGDLKDKLYPPPAFPIIDKAYNLPPIWAATGEAPLHYAYFMIAGDIWFLFIGAFIVGLVLGMIQRRLVNGNRKHQVFSIILCLALFMWYTRGYFPQFVDNLIFLFIPFFTYYGLVKSYEI
ncbi:MAG: O-antigen polymerase [Saprospiraceae bacterium]